MASVFIHEAHENYLYYCGKWRAMYTGRFACSHDGACGRQKYKLMQQRTPWTDRLDRSRREADLADLDLKIMKFDRESMFIIEKTALSVVFRQLITSIRSLTFLQSVIFL